MQFHTIVKEVILSASNEIVKGMLGENVKRKISLVLLSNDTMSLRIDDMCSDI